VYGEGGNVCPLSWVLVPLDIDHAVCRCMAESRFVGLCSTIAMHDGTALSRRGKNMEKYVEQCQAWARGLTRPIWPDV
jgi:hypothetical protein